MSRKAVIVANERAPHHLSFGAAFMAGLLRRGWRAEMSTSDKPCDLLVRWGVRDRAMIQRQRDAGGEVCILERGYLGDRFEWTSVSFGGGLNGRGRFVIPGHAAYDMTRFRAVAELQPWHLDSDGYALIMGQVPGDQSLKHVNFEKWVRETGTELAAAGWPVRFRPHPGNRGGQEYPGVKPLRGTLAEALAGAGLVVTFNSNSGVDAVLAGRPTVAMDEGSMVRPVAAHDMRVIAPDRSAWAARLAWCQYRRDEMESGFCQEMCGL